MTAAGIDALKTLGLKPGCAEQDVTQAYRRLARKRHPDKGGNKEDFQRLRAAYELLTTIGIPDAPCSAPAAKQATPAPAANPFAKMWAEAQRLSAEERHAARRAAAQRASMSGTERAREETRRRKRQREEEERRHAEEWEELRREQAQQRAHKENETARKCKQVRTRRSGGAKMNQFLSCPLSRHSPFLFCSPLPTSSHFLLARNSFSPSLA